MRLVMGHVDDLDDRVLRFARQLGLSGIQLHAPRNLPGDAGHWRLADLVAIRQRCEDAGLVLEGIENVPRAHWDRVLRGERDVGDQLEQYCRTVRHMGEAGIPVLGHNFMPAYVWRTEMRAEGRGGAAVSAFDLADALARGNGLDYASLSPADAPPQPPVGEQQMWDAYTRFLETVLPVAEESGVVLALHPDDPPVREPLGGYARLFSGPEGLERAYALSGGSPAWALCLCLGTVSEHGGEASVNRVVDFFAPRGRVALVHFRDVRGTVPSFAEGFLGEGNLRVGAVLRRLADAGFDGFVIDDHVPAMVGDVDTWGDTSPDAYVSRGRAHAVGYLSGAMDALGLG